MINLKLSVTVMMGHTQQLKYKFLQHENYGYTNL
jgi:hypothetical protein